MTPIKIAIGGLGPTKTSATVRIDSDVLA